MLNHNVLTNKERSVIMKNNTYVFQINALHDSEFLQTTYTVEANTPEEAHQKAEAYGMYQYGYDYLEAIDMTNVA